MYAVDWKGCECACTCMITHHRSGSTNQSPSHSHPRGGRKRSCLSFTFPVTSENLWRPTKPVVPHLPNTWAWFSYYRGGKKQQCIQAIVYTIPSKVSSHKCLYLFLQKQMFCIYTVPFQRTHWSFPLRKYWTFSLGQRDRATCWSSAELGSSDLFLCPWDTEYKN